MKLKNDKGLIITIILELVLIVALVKGLFFYEEPVVFSGELDTYQVSDYNEDVVFYLNGEAVVFSINEEYHLDLSGKEAILVLPCGESPNDLWKLEDGKNIHVYSSHRKIEEVFLADVEINGEPDVIYMEKLWILGESNRTITYYKELGTKKICIRITL